MDPTSQSAWEEAIVEMAQTRLKEAWHLSLMTEDEDLFEKVWNEAARMVVSETVNGLVEKGLLDIAGVTEDGDLTFQVTQAGIEALEAETEARQSSIDWNMDWESED